MMPAHDMVYLPQRRGTENGQGILGRSCSFILRVDIISRIPAYVFQASPRIKQEAVHCSCSCTLIYMYRYISLVLHVYYYESYVYTWVCSHARNTFGPLRKTSHAKNKIASRIIPSSVPCFWDKNTVACHFAGIFW